MRLLAPLHAAGVNRSTFIRRISRLGHPRLRELRARALEGRRLSDRLLGAAVRGLEQGVLQVPQGHGHGLLLDMRYIPLSHAHLGSFAFGSLESAVQEALIRHLGPGDVLYDVGANLGFFSLLGARLAGAEGHVYAFEAAPDNAAAIASNVQLNRVGNVTVIQKAVAAAGGVGRLQVVDDQSWSKLEDYGEHPNTERVIEVELVALDDLVAAGEVRVPTVVKIDVEGAEIAVLEGMRETIRRHRPAIICELHGTHREFVALMREHGYRLVNLEGTAPVEQAGASGHALAMPPGAEGD